METGVLRPMAALYHGRVLGSYPEVCSGRSDIRLPSASRKINRLNCPPAGPVSIVRTAVSAPRGELRAMRQPLALRLTTWKNDPSGYPT